MIIWIVGQHKQDGWEFQGAFSSEENAIKACRTSQYFVGSTNLDQELPSETFDWPNAYYPIAPK